MLGLARESQEFLIQGFGLRNDIYHRIHVTNLERKSIFVVLLKKMGYTIGQTALSFFIYYKQ